MNPTMIVITEKNSNSKLFPNGGAGGYSGLFANENSLQKTGALSYKDYKLQQQMQQQ